MVTEVQVTSYTYSNSVLSGTITLYNNAYSKTVTVNYDDLSGSWSYSCAAAYSSGPNSTNYEFWTFSCPIGSAGISQFYVAYTVSGTTYYDNNGGYGVNYKVTTSSTTSTSTTSSSTSATGTTTTSTSSTSSVSSSTATPTGLYGFGSDISTWLVSAIPTAQTLMLANIHPTGTSAGVVVAAPSVQPISQN
ncbi:glycoside hydrolase 15 protein [Cladochytrium tenue]|nr:glycoside hydrolase 15 protein [Cladochytrium tenue]